MDSVEIKGLACRLTYDAAADEITIKHTGYGRATAPASQLVAIDLREPVGPIPGKLRLAVRADIRRGLLPKEPWRFDFPGKVTDEVKKLYYALAPRVQGL